MIRLAFTCRNSSPRYSPIPKCRSTRSSSAKSIGCPPSSSLSRQRNSALSTTSANVSEHMFDSPAASRPICITLAMYVRAANRYSPLQWPTQDALLSKNAGPQPEQGCFLLQRTCSRSTGSTGCPSTPLRPRPGARREPSTTTSGPSTGCCSLFWTTGAERSSR